MKLLFYSLLCWLPAASLAFPQGQTNGDPLPVRETIFYAQEGNPDWLVIREGVQITAEDLLRSHHSDLGLSDQDALLEYRTDTDELGFTHHRYQQYYKGVKVAGAELLIHEQNGYVKTLNGKLVRGLQAQIPSGLTAQEAIGKALAHTNAQRYMWESPETEALLRQVRKNPAATFYPQPELVLANPNEAQRPEGFVAAWTFEVFAQQPQSRKQVFVRVTDGTVIQELELLHDQNTPGTAITKYSNQRAIITDSLSDGNFRLMETTRGGGVWAYNMNKSTDFANATDFLDTDNIWNNVNVNQDEAATDAYWGAEMTYDYYFQEHGHSGIDGNDMPLICLVHFNENWVNASWTGDWAQFGDGNSSYSPLTSLDVVSHEFTHGVTGNTAGLIYQNESGALNESFSDIFGAAVEFWATPEQADWLVGEDFAHNSSNIFRNMHNPKAYGDPDTYKGENWKTGTADNGGVHSNSGVQNRWFVLLTDGGTGTNDNDDDYVVNGVGLDTAAAIAFRNLKYYLVQSSKYADARLGSLQAALDLYGPCSSPGYIETTNAWYAVGIGDQLYYYDLNLLDITGPAPLTCHLTDTEYITVRFKYNDCSTTIPAGGKIPMAFIINDGVEVWDTLTLTAPLYYGDTISFKFNVPTDAFATPGVYKIRCKTGLATDLNIKNNETKVVVESILDQNVDISLRDVDDLQSGCFLGSETPKLEIGYFGCDSIAAGEEVTVFVSLNGSAPVSEVVQIPQTLHLGESFLHTLSTSFDFSANGPYSVDSWVTYDPDFLSGNDSLNALRIVNPYVFYRDTLSFEAGGASLDSSFTRSGRFVETTLASDAARTGALGFKITGGDVLAAYNEGDFVEPADTNVWIRNEAFRNEFCICADLTGLNSAQLQFDLRQTFSTFYLTNFGKNNPYASTMRVLVNGNQESTEYKPSTFKNDPWKTRTINLAAYLGNQVEICFQTHTALNVNFDPAGIGDKVMLDNIIIKGELSVGTSNPSARKDNWTVYPNPGHGAFTISYDAESSQELAIEVTDGPGRVIRSLHQNLTQGKNLIPLDLNGMPAGIYFIRLTSGHSKQVGKIAIN